MPSSAIAVSCWLGLAILLAPASEGVEPRPNELLDGSGYEARLHALLDDARVSVDAIIYLVHLPTDARPAQPVRRILDHLAATRRRGVAVRILFDAGAPPGESDTKPNQTAAHALRTAGVEVRWDEDDRITHAKAMVADGRHCLVGSGNWTASALRSNREMNVYLDSPAIAAQFSAVFEPAWKAGTPVP